MAVSHGQTEAAHALGLRPGKTLRLVVIPQAMRVIIPPLTSTISEPHQELLAGRCHRLSGSRRDGRHVLNQTGQAIEIVVIWMIVYLTPQPAHVRAS